MRTIERRLQALELRRQAIDEKREDEVFGAALRLLSDAELHQFDSIALRHEAGEPLENMCESDRQFVEKLEAMCEAIAP